MWPGNQLIAMNILKKLINNAGDFNKFLARLASYTND
jgi:hypothetical protein